MKTQEWTFVDKSQWPERGPWDDEPDKKQWLDESTGLPCLIHRGPRGALCGYVGVPSGHQFYEADYDAVEPLDGNDYLEVHGGLTYADKCGPTRENGGGICHTVESGEDDNVWWLGFDCSHSGDLAPGRNSSFGFEEIYRDIVYVTREVERLAKQLAQP